MKIYCPKCKWEPSPDDRWLCGVADCAHVWNTFETMGRCPNCGKIWQDTQCLRCHRWSKHMDWYHFDPPTDEELAEEEFDELQTVNE
ncbi:hypothetical protein GWO43_11840 [candidate division KSB1 bacterium]|nr:hypothetical protein [candidate division KSB1 bacterium]NIR70868.1 hypothetical protein [candidate division KSB1 bacterium]NIS24654.1 hypothetical protein [candidate division KSB1 bacterium]NIT71556.1 hypothetical protein [candidate division KSB1 bacterium]NIU25254.1 hypothetical protein [candidate division KSB1 bacterium]